MNAVALDEQSLNRLAEGRRIYAGLALSGKWLSFDSRVPGQAHRLAIAGVPTLDDDEILRRILVRAAILADDEVLASRKLLWQIRG